MSQRKFCVDGVCGNARSGPYTAEQCRTCWLRRHGRAERIGTALASVRRRRLPCRYLGGPAGQAQCDECGQHHLSVETRRCAKHEECSVERPTRRVVDGVSKKLPYCRTCDDHAPEPAVVHVCNHGLGDNVQWTIVVRHLRRHEPDTVQHVVAQRGKHSVYHGHADHVHVRDDARPPEGLRARALEFPWHNPHLCYSDCPSTKATHTLREVLGLAVVPELCRYEIRVSAEARQRARQWVEGNVASERFALLHHQGTSWTEAKNVSHDDMRLLVDALLLRHVTPVILEMDGWSPLATHRRILVLGRRDPLWGGIGTGDAETMAALMELSSLNVGIDSGPGKVMASVATTPCLTVWRQLHPLHFSDLDYGQVLHMVPEDHARYLQGDERTRPGALAYFAQHYRHATYRPGQLAERIRAEALALLSGRQELGTGGFDVVPYLHPDDPWPREEGIENVRACYRAKYDLARLLQPRRILEMGVRAGYSAAAFLAACPSAQYHGVDADDGTDGGVRGYSQWAQEMLRQRFPEAVVCVSLLDTQTVRPDQLGNGFYDFVHVDADHTYAGCQRDLNLAAAVAASGGWILVDDTTYIPEVARAVRDWLARTDHACLHLPTLRGDCLIRLAEAVRR